MIPIWCSRRMFSCTVYNRLYYECASHTYTHTNNLVVSIAIVECSSIGSNKIRELLLYRCGGVEIYLVKIEIKCRSVTAFPMKSHTNTNSHTHTRAHHAVGVCSSSHSSQRNNDGASSRNGEAFRNERMSTNI